jgi:DNA-binding NtrC family response regulator
LFLNYPWPGNIRELENLVERLVVLTKEGVIGPEKLPAEIKGEMPCLPEATETNLFEAVRKFEADFIKRALEKTGGKKSEAAKLLGIHRNTLLGLRKRLKLKD